MTPLYRPLPVNNEKLQWLAPSPAGEEWGEENKIKALFISPHLTFPLWRGLLDLSKYLCFMWEGLLAATNNHDQRSPQ